MIWLCKGPLESSIMGIVLRNLLDGSDSDLLVLGTSCQRSGAGAEGFGVVREGIIRLYCKNP